jgi:hypothetical protein
LIFNEIIPDNIQQILSEIPTFIDINKNKAIFQIITNQIPNNDITKTLRILKDLLLTEKKNIVPIPDTYSVLIEKLLEVGDIYSIFTEMILCNLYINKQNMVFRYALKNKADTTIYKKFNVETIHSLLSPTLAMLYKPNKQTIKRFYNQELDNSNNKSRKLSILEQFWYDKY